MSSSSSISDDGTVVVNSKLSTVLSILCALPVTLAFIWLICACLCKKVKRTRANRLVNHHNNAALPIVQPEIQQIDINIAVEDNIGGLSRQQIDRLSRVTFNPTANPNSDYQTDKMCMVCLSDYTKKDKLINLPCKHSFHETCAVPWLQSNARCPLCSWSPLVPAEPPRAYITIEVDRVM